MLNIPYLVWSFDAVILLFSREGGWKPHFSRDVFALVKSHFNNSTQDLESHCIVFCWSQIQLAEGCVDETIPRTGAGMLLKVLFKSNVNTLRVHWEEGNSQMVLLEERWLCKAIWRYWWSVHTHENIPQFSHPLLQSHCLVFYHLEMHWFYKVPLTNKQPLP